jgi:hypothetical protein
VIFLKPGVYWIQEHAINGLQKPVTVYACKMTVCAKLLNMVFERAIVEKNI